MANYPAINKSYAQTQFNLTHKPGRSVQHIVIHYTATDAPATNNAKYFGSANRNSSADYFIDKDGTIVQFNADPHNYYSWHCGDGGGRYGISNAYSIGIEVVSAGEDFTQAQKDALHALVLALMEDYGVPATRVVRHFDASRKLCPAPYCGTSSQDPKHQKWLVLWKYITARDEEEEVKDEDIEKIANKAAEKVWNYMVGHDAVAGRNNAPAWHYLSMIWNHQEWMKKNQGTKDDIAKAVGTRKISKKDIKANMSIDDFAAWTNYDTAKMLPLIQDIQKRLADIEKKIK